MIFIKQSLILHSLELGPYHGCWCGHYHVMNRHIIDYKLFYQVPPPPHSDIFQSIIDLVQPSHFYISRSSCKYCHMVWIHNFKDTSGSVTSKCHVILVQIVFCDQTVIRCFADFCFVIMPPFQFRERIHLSLKLPEYEHMTAAGKPILVVQKQCLTVYII